MMSEMARRVGYDIASVGHVSLEYTTGPHGRVCPDMHVSDPSPSFLIDMDNTMFPLYRAMPRRRGLAATTCHLQRRKNYLY